MFVRAVDGCGLVGADQDVERQVAGRGQEPAGLRLRAGGEVAVHVVREAGHAERLMSNAGVRLAGQQLEHLLSRPSDARNAAERTATRGADVASLRATARSSVRSSTRFFSTSHTFASKAASARARWSATESGRLSSAACSILMALRCAFATGD